jgi:hypothetical protein
VQAKALAKGQPVPKEIAQAVALWTVHWEAAWKAAHTCIAAQKVAQATNTPIELPIAGDNDPVDDVLQDLSIMSIMLSMLSTCFSNIFTYITITFFF